MNPLEPIIAFILSFGGGIGIFIVVAAFWYFIGGAGKIQKNERAHNANWKKGDDYHDHEYAPKSEFFENFGLTIITLTIVVIIFLKLTQ